MTFKSFPTLIRLSEFLFLRLQLFALLGDHIATGLIELRSRHLFVDRGDLGLKFLDLPWQQLQFALIVVRKLDRLGGRLRSGTFLGVRI